MNLFRRFIEFFTRRKYPQNLLIKGRKQLPTSSFQDQEKLYRAYDKDDIDEKEEIGLETIRFPDFSCNWSKFSKPQDILFIKNAKKNDGCYSFTVLTSRYNSMATPVHEPIDDYKYPNYSHVEVRELKPGENIHFDPPKGRKSKSKIAKDRRMVYRHNLLRNLLIEFEAN